MRGLPPPSGGGVAPSTSTSRSRTLGSVSTIATLPLPVLLVTGLAVVALSGCTVGVDIGGETVERREVETIDVDGIERIVIETENGEVRVDGTAAGGADDGIELVVRLRESDDGAATYRVDRDGTTLSVAGECDSGWWDECSVGFAVTLPADLDVDVETDNGRIELTGLAGAVDASSDNGAITAASLTSGRIVARTDNGRIELAFAAPPDDVEVETDNGAVAIGFPDDGRGHDVDTSTDNGAVDVDVRTDPDASRRISVVTANGSIRVAYADR